MIVPHVEECFAEQAMKMRACSILIESGELDAEAAAGPILRWTQDGLDIARMLIAQGLVKAPVFYQALAEAYDLPFIDLRQEPCDRRLLKMADCSHYTRLRLLPWQAHGGVTLIATTEAGPEQHAFAASRYGARGYGFLITSPFDILWEYQRCLPDGYANSPPAAPPRLEEKAQPVHGVSDTRRLKAVSALAGMATIVALAAAPQSVAMAGTIALCVIFSAALVMHQYR